MGEELAHYNQENNSVDIKGLFKGLPAKIFKKGLFKKKKIIIVISVAVFIVLLVIVFFLFFRSDGEDSTADNDSGLENIHINKVDYDNIIVLKPFTWIALKDNSYMGKVSIGIALELISEDMVDLVETHRDDIRAFVRDSAAEMRWIEMRSPEGKLKFKYMLIKKINSLFPDIVIRNLYLTHFIMR